MKRILQLGLLVALPPLYFLSDGFAADPLVSGKNFQVPIRQEIHFVDLVPFDSSLMTDASIPKLIDLRALQSPVKHQGKRGACTYFVITSLVESLLKRSLGKTFDISEEYLAWAGKTRGRLRVDEEDSSVAVNAFTVQNFGVMLETDFPYQTSWFNAGMPCAGKKDEKPVDPECYAHRGPNPNQQKRVMLGKGFVFEAVSSSSAAVVRAIARFKNPVTASISVHPQAWSESLQSGRVALTAERKTECIANPDLCSGHAVLIVGYDLNKRLFTFKNSWGEEWGDHGYGTIAFDYMDQMSVRKFVTAYVDRSGRGLPALATKVPTRPQ